MKISLLVSILFLFFLCTSLLIALFFLQKTQDIRQRAAGPITYGSCVGSPPLLAQGMCYADPNTCSSQGLTTYYTDVVPPAMSTCAINGFNAGLSHGTSISCCPNSSTYVHTYGGCGSSSNPGTCTTDTCVGIPITTDTVPTQCLMNGFNAKLITGTKTYCCSLPPSPTPTPTIVPCGTVCGVNFSCGTPITVSGRVTDAATGNGVNGLSITIYDNNRHNNPSLYVRYSDTVQTNLTGNFSETPLVCGGFGTPGNYGDAYSVNPDWNTCIPGYSCTNPTPAYLAPGQQANKPGVPDCAKNASCNFTVTLTKQQPASISFSLSGIGLGGNMHPQHTVRTFKVYFSPHVFAESLLAKNTNQQVLGTQIITVTGTAQYNSSSGIFQTNNLSVSAVPPGQYDVILHVDGGLDTFLLPSGGGTFFTIATGQTMSAITASLSQGDIAPPPAGDNFVDIQDYNAMLSCLASAGCQSRALADLNDDGIIDGNDLDLLMQSFGQLGQSFSTPKFGCVLDPNCQSGGKTMQFCQLICTIKPGL